jgi:hypothetical protein
VPSGPMILVLSAPIFGWTVGWNVNKGQHSLSARADIHRKEGITMSDRNSAEQAGALGPIAHPHDMALVQIRNHSPASVDLARLAGDMSKLRQKMKMEAVDPERDIVVSHVVKAEQGARAARVNG